jgi:hypothetical protein
MNQNKHKKTRPLIKDEIITRGTTSFEPHLTAQLHSRGRMGMMERSRSPIYRGMRSAFQSSPYMNRSPVNGEVSGQLLADTLRWVQSGIRLPTFTLSARCPVLPLSTDPDPCVVCSIVQAKHT